MLGALDIDESSDKSVGQQLKEALRKNAGRVIDLTPNPNPNPRPNPRPNPSPNP